MSDDPMDYYDEYMAWLQRHYSERVTSGDSLIELFEAGEGFEEFLAERAKP